MSQTCFGSDPFKCRKSTKILVEVCFSRTSRSHTQDKLLNQWFLTKGVSVDFKECASPYAHCNMECLINKLTNKYICLHNMFLSGRFETKDNYLKWTW